MLNEVKEFVKNNKEEIIICSCIAAVAGLSFYFGYKAGKVRGFSSGMNYGYPRGLGDGVASVANGSIAGIEWNGNVYKFMVEKSTAEAILASDPNIIYDPKKWPTKVMLP